MLATKRTLVAGVSLLTLLTLLVACGSTPTPVVVRETVIVAGTPQIVEVTKVVEETIEVEKVVTPTALPGRDVIIVGLASAPETLDPADHRSRQSETVIRNMFDGLVTRDTRSGSLPTV